MSEETGKSAGDSVGRDGKKAQGGKKGNHPRAAVEEATAFSGL